MNIECTKCSSAMAKIKTKVDQGFMNDGFNLPRYRRNEWCAC